MDDLDKILLTSLLTVVGGTLVYIFGQIAAEFFIKPVQQLWRHCGHIQDKISYYAFVYQNPASDLGSDVRKEAFEEFRRCAAQLRAAAYGIALYDALAACKVIPRRASIDAAATSLVGLSNGVTSSGIAEHNLKYRKTVERELNMPALEA